MSDPYCIQIETTGGPDVLKRAPLDLAPPGEGQVRLRIEAAGLNFIDTYHRTGLYPVKLPFIPGQEAAGFIEAVGPGVEGFAEGDCVAYLGPGCYASHVNADASRLFALPEGVSFDTAAALLLKGLTAWMLLFEVRAARPGDTALVWAPVGGVGSVLVPWARSLGVEVIAVTSSEDKADQARDLGAGYVVMRSDDVANAVREITGGRGVDVAYDSVGRSSADASLASLRPRGWYVSYGNASGPADPIAPGRLGQLGSLVMTRPSLFSFLTTGDERRRGAAALFGALQAGTIAAVIGQDYPLEDVARAQERLEAGETSGATVLWP